MRNRQEKGTEMDRELDVTWSYAIACAEVCLFSCMFVVRSTGLWPLFVSPEAPFEQTLLHSTINTLPVVYKIQLRHLQSTCSSPRFVSPRA